MGYRSRAVTVGLLSVMAGCSGGTDLPVPDQIARVADTEGQSAPAGARLPRPLAVEVRASDGVAVPQVRVRWRVTGGGGSVRDSVTLSDGLGRAQADFVLGATPGPQAVVAELVTQSNRSVSFSAIATAPPTLTSVSSAQVTGGDVVTLAGTALSDGAVVEIGGAPARVTAGSATSITAVVPVCLVPGFLASSSSSKLSDRG